MGDIKFHLSVCETKPFVELDGQMFLAGHRGEVNINHSIKDDVLYLDFDWCGHKPWVGDASRVVAVSIRVCPSAVTSIAIYDDPLMNMQGCCHCCSNGCCVYGNSGCGCG